MGMAGCSSSGRHAAVALGWRINAVVLAQAGTFQLDAVGAVNDAVQNRIPDRWIADHRMMPQKLTVASLRFEWSTRTTHCSAVIFQ